MEHKKSIYWASFAGMVLLALSSIISVMWDDGGVMREFISIHGMTVQIYGGSGPYRFDSMNKALMFRGFDIVNLIVVVPVFLIGLISLRKNSFFGLIILLSCNIYLVYIYLIGAMGNSFNELFLIWTAIFASGILGTFFIASGLRKIELGSLFRNDFPAKTMTVYMLVLAAFLFFSYTADIILSYARNSVPESLEHYTTLELASLELGIMVPLHLLAAISLIRKNPFGYLLSLALSFATVLTFLSLTLFSVIKYFQYHLGTSDGLIVPVALAIASGFCTVRAFKSSNRA